MFGYNISQIAEGWVNDALKREQELYEKRIKICKECPLFTSDSIVGPRCDAKKCLNVKTGKLTDLPGKDVICGCSCALDKKTRVPNAKCVLNKW